MTKSSTEEQKRAAIERLLSEREEVSLKSVLRFSAICFGHTLEETSIIAGIDLTDYVEREEQDND